MMTPQRVATLLMKRRKAIAKEHTRLRELRDEVNEQMQTTDRALAVIDECISKLHELL